MSRIIIMVLMLTSAMSARADDFVWNMRYQSPLNPETSAFERRIRVEAWSANRTAFIVCDVWDKHHCLNAVKRLEEFGPRLNQVLVAARKAGAVIIHAPSDCMPAYETHPARLRAMQTPVASNRPPLVESWCSTIPAEEEAAYPIDQSDGGEDDDPEEHLRWSAELTSLGRNPAMPWKSQNALIEIDPEHDYISDRGDEVWNILEEHDVSQVVLTGVHTNMCVLGRPFGLRRMVSSGRKVVLMRDMTDCMYNPKRWPFVDHFTGNDLIISHVERYVCPTVTSDQILGGEPFRFSGDRRSQQDTMQVTSAPPDADALQEYWVTAQLPGTWNDLTAGTVADRSGATWYRCTLRVNTDQLAAGAPVVVVTPPEKGTVQVWLNGHDVRGSKELCLSCSGPDAVRFALPLEHLIANDANLLVIRSESGKHNTDLLAPPTLEYGTIHESLAGRWQLRTDDNPDYRNMPLPAKFGTASDVVFGASTR